MHVDFPLVEKIAVLARLEFSGEEKEQIRGDMEKVLTFVEKLNELDTENVDPLIYVTDEHDVKREDVSKTFITHEEA
ncbi:MAG: aspartyl-tRNA(Asn)/glutamyl-tRNA(Gln) amidotransferase subunit C, partial [Sphingobacteriales bacterium]